MGSLPIARTFIAGEVENGTYMNSLSLAVAFLLNPPRTMCYNSAVHTMTSGTPLMFTWDTEQYDTDGIHSPTTNPSRLTPQTAGLYHVEGQIDFAASAVGARQVGILFNGSTAAAYDTQPTGSAVLQCSKDIYFNGTTDYVELQGLQTSGGNLNDTAGPGLTWFSCRWVANS
jgi:hypothetical protein